MLKAEYADDPAFRQRFAIEARHAAALHHPGVAGVFDFGEAHPAGIADGSGVPRPFLVMELVEGEPLSTLLRQGLASQRNLDRDAVRDLLAQAGDAIGAAHTAGIVHRDVKPANLMVTPGGQLKVTDFGIARAADGAGITQTGAVMGTPQYLSPEQAQGQPATSRSDVYSLGVVAFECLAGRRPFEADSPVATALAHIREPVPDLPADVPADLAAVVRRALAKDPADRYADGAEFATALRNPATELLRKPQVVVPSAVPVPGPDATQVLPRNRVVTGRPGAAARPGTTAGRKRAPWLAVLVTLLAVALVVAVVLLVTTADDDPETPPSDQTSTPTNTPTDETTPTDADQQCLRGDHRDRRGRLPRPADRRGRLRAQRPRPQRRPQRGRQRPRPNRGSGVRREPDRFAGSRRHRDRQLLGTARRPTPTDPKTTETTPTDEPLTPRRRRPHDDSL